MDKENMVMRQKDMKSNHILVTGSHRSATTFVGRILSMPLQVSYIQEPSNKNSGIEGINHWFPYIDVKNPNSSRYSSLYHKLVDFNVRYKKEIPSTDPVVEKLLKRMISGKPNIHYLKAQLFSWIPGPIGDRLLLKDPLGAFASDFLATELGFQVLILVRHPGAFYASLKRPPETHFDFNNFLEQEELIENHLKELVPMMMETSKTFAYEVGLLWLCIYRVLSQFTKKHPDWFVVKHEDICLEPVNSFKRIFEWANLKFTSRIENKVRNLTNKDNPVEVKKGRKLARNSRKLVDYWKEKVSEEEREVLYKITSPIANIYYDKDSWY